MNRRGQWVSLFAAMAAVVMVVAAGAITAQAGPVKVRVGYLNIPHYTLVAYANEKGYFAQEGIEVQLAGFASGPPMMAAMAGGSVDVGLLGCVPILNTAATKAFDFYLLSVFEDTTAAMSVATKDPSIRTLQDLRGKMVAIPYGTGMHYFLQLALAKAGMTTRDVVLVNMEPADAMYAMLSGRVAATVPFGGYVFAFLREGGWPIFWGYRLWEEAPVLDVRLPDVIIARKAFADQNPGAVVSFLKAFYRAVDDYHANPVQVVDWELAFVERVTGVGADPMHRKLLLARGGSEPGTWIEKPTWILWTAEEQLQLLKSGRAASWFAGAGQFFKDVGIIPAVPDLTNIIAPHSAV